MDEDLFFQMEIFWLLEILQSFFVSLWTFYKCTQFFLQSFDIFAMKLEELILEGASNFTTNFSNMRLKLLFFSTFYVWSSLSHIFRKRKINTDYSLNGFISLSRFSSLFFMKNRHFLLENCNYSWYMIQTINANDQNER